MGALPSEIPDKDPEFDVLDIVRSSGSREESGLEREMHTSFKLTRLPAARGEILCRWM